MSTFVIVPEAWDTPAMLEPLVALAELLIAGAR